ncbi:MAG TPA: hypothetical protein VIG46_02400 [Candidatus Baltobacteraceae bacterium]|jgi:hypothetical protein
MTSISERHFVPCPYGLAKQFLTDELFPSDGGQLEWILHVAPPVPKGIDVSKDVDVSVSRAIDPMHFDEPWNVCWQPHGGGPFPTFSGTLTVRADEDWNVSALELAGTYEPPLGPAGKAFDMLLGARLATLTAKALLSQIGDRLIAHYHSEEAAKRASS